ncbi:uncharacterized protein [Antedon mediterranea]|uniref:uncharacterized protein n=1 Tax=Antedon mediterranea TaxID=105859 RepID=UPI003AF75E35
MASQPSEPCRLCGDLKLSTDCKRSLNSQKKERFIIEIKTIFGFDVSDENDERQFICSKCKEKLLNCKKSRYRKKCTIELNDNVNKLSLDKVAKFVKGIDLVVLQKSNNFLQVLWFLDDEISTRLKICYDGKWNLSVFGLPKEINEYPEILTIDMMTALISFIDNHAVCQGNTDFQDIVEAKGGEMIPIHITSNDIYSEQYKTVRNKLCYLLIDQNSIRCLRCKDSRDNLTRLRRRMKGRKDGRGKSAPNDSLTRNELKLKISETVKELTAAKKLVVSQQKRIEELMNRESAELLAGTVAGVEDRIPNPASELPEGSPARLLYDQQVKSNKSGSGMRWHPTIVQFCIALHSKSSVAYKFIRDSQMLKLPHPQTLLNYTQFGEVKGGINPDVLCNEAQIWLGKRLQEHVALLIDEVKIESGPEFSKFTGNLVGFSDIGDLSNEISELERKSNGKEEQLATHMLMVMMRGIFSDMNVSVGFFTTDSLKGSQLYQIMKEVIDKVEAAGFLVHGIIGDGSPSFRNLFKISALDGNKHYMVNPVDSSRKIYFFSDVPNLLKTIRNDVENSGSNNQTRNLYFNSQLIIWKDFKDTVEWDRGSEPGLSKLDKIKKEHLNLTPSLRMRVDLATQVLSTSMANAMESMDENTGTSHSSTIAFIRMVDKFFDCLNVRKLPSEDQDKPELEPYRTKVDWRFKWLKEEFLGFLDKWEEQVNLLNECKATKNKMLLSSETLFGLRLTVNSFIDLGEFLLENYVSEGEFLLSGHLNRDPIENDFDKESECDGNDANPTALENQQSSSGASKRANCNDDVSQLGQLDDTPPVSKKTKNRNPIENDFDKESECDGNDAHPTALENQQSSSGASKRANCNDDVSQLSQLDDTPPVSKKTKNRKPIENDFDKESECDGSDAHPTALENQQSSSGLLKEPTVMMM